MYQTYIIILFRFIRINCFKLKKDKTNTMQANHRLYKHLFCNFVLYFFVIENLALCGHTGQRHPFSPERSDFVSENAVDGLYDDRSPFGNQCTISDNYRYTAEWRVDLGSVVSISHVNIFYRTDNLRSMVISFIF